MENPFKKHKQEMLVIRKTARRQCQHTLLSLTRSDLKLNVFTDVCKQIGQQDLDLEDDFWVKIIENPVALICRLRVGGVKYIAYVVSVCISVTDASSAMLCHLIILLILLDSSPWHILCVQYTHRKKQTYRPVRRGYH